MPRPLTVDGTRLARFMKLNRVSPSALARFSSYSRQHILRLRRGTMDPTRKAMIQIATGCSVALNRRVHVWEVFDIGEDDVIREFIRIPSRGL